MSYTVCYVPTRKGRFGKKRIRLWVLLVPLVLISGIVIAGCMWPTETARICETLFPWTQDSVQEAFIILQDELEAGEPLKDAITSFCLEIVNNEAIAR